MKKSFTLIELAVFMGLFSILLFILTDIFVNSLKEKSYSDTVSVVNQDGRYILKKLENDINNANSIDSPVLGQTDNFLSLIVYGQIQTYSLSNGTLNLFKGGETLALNSVYSTVNSISFTRLGNAGGKNSIRIILSLQSKKIVNNKPELINLETSASLR